MRTSRRRPFRHLGLLAVVGLAAVMGGKASNAQSLPPPPSATPTPPVTITPNTSCLLAPPVRRSIATLTPAQITTLRNGIAEMKRRSNNNRNDPTGWIYQANIHGTFDTPVRTAWNSCRHNSYFFLSWHRMYLYHFERILRKATGDNSFNLPYWNYSDPGQRRLPLPYRSPANTATNPLFVTQRVSGMNNGTAQLSASAVNIASAFAFVNFDNSSASFTRRLESTPHGVVHTSIGGQSGWMSSFQLAGRDPVFWLHHANIDRLWNRWIQQGGGRTNPTGDSTWMNTTFTFFNDNGTQVQMKGSEVVATARNLCYRYDDDPPVLLPTPRATGTQRAMPPIREAAPEAISTSSAPVELDASRVRVSLPVPEARRGRLARALTPETEDRVVLSIEDIDFEQFPGIYYEVYVNVPEGETPDAESAYYVGNLQFFGVEPHAARRGEAAARTTETFDITANVRALKEADRWTEGKVSVVLVPRGLVGANQQPLAARPASKVRVGRISLGAGG